MNKVSVRIDGVEYQIAGEKNEVEIIKVAKYIDGELKKISKAAPSLNKTNVAILTSVNIADKFFDLSNENEKLKEKIEKMENNYSSTNEDIEKEFDSVLQKLDESETKVLGMGNEISRLEKILAEKEESIKKLLEDKKEVSKIDPNAQKTIKSLELKLKEMENKVSVAESMAVEFQNKAYNIQLNYEKLKNSLDK